jgi:hypothetical protein
MKCLYLTASYAKQKQPNPTPGGLVAFLECKSAQVINNANQGLQGRFFKIVIRFAVDVRLRTMAHQV